MTRGFAIMPLVLAALALGFCWHIAVGAKSVPLVTVFEALTNYDQSIFDHAVIYNLRLPRAIFAVVAGASLSVAGALMQGITRNPLADPGILGLMIGASFAVVMTFGYFSFSQVAFMPLVAAGGALVAAVLVWGIALAAPGGATPLTLVLSGAAISTFLGAIITMVHLLDEDSYIEMRVWLTGSLTGARMDILYWALPWVVGGMALALTLARQVTALAMGEDTANGLGVDVVRLKSLAMISVVVLTGSAVSIVGPLGFIGLVIPHVVRLFVGADYRLIVPYSAAVGALYLLLIDIVARIVLAPIEISTGIVTAMLGGPFFVWLVRARL
ncbi:MAG: iron ABC transporter permease [Rhodobacteraceae bacterium]|nr:iron ABC transporter permease [Paracoccaceae bacterium]